MQVDIIAYTPVTVTFETKAELNDFLQILHDYSQNWYGKQHLSLAGKLLDLIKARIIG